MPISAYLYICIAISSAIVIVYVTVLHNKFIIPNLPSLPSLPQMPQLPSLPNLHNIPDFSGIPEISHIQIPEYGSNIQ